MLLRVLFPGLLSLFLFAPASHASTSGTPATFQPNALLPFSAAYQSTYKLGWFSFTIDATRSLTAIDPQHWRMAFNASASVATLKESSEFRLEGQQLLPQEYRYRASGILQEDDRTLSFNLPEQQIYDHERQRQINEQWQPGLQDNLTYMLQASLDLAAGKTELTYPILERKHTKVRAFRVVGTETINTAIGPLKAVKVQQLRDEKDRLIFAWFAIDQHYQLVRLTDSKKGKLQYQIDIRHLQFGTAP